MRFKDQQSGYVLVVVAGLLFVLVGFTALAVDLGSLLGARTQSQRAADAAALAGAFTFILNPTAQPATARAHATETAVRNKVMGASISPAEVTIDVDVDNKRVTVTIRRHESAFFAQALNIASVDVAVHATAEAAINATGASCVKPFFIPNTIFSSKQPCDAAKNGELLVAGVQATSYALARINGGTNQVRIKPSDPQNALRAGDFYELDIDGGGGAGYSDNIARCNTAQVACRTSYSILTGNKMGPTIQGVQDLVGHPANDSYISVGHYQTPTGIRDTSKALTIAPIWDLTTESVPPYGPGGFCPPPVGTCTGDPKDCQSFPAGTNVSVTVIGFALVFIEDVNGGDVIGRIVNVAACGATPPSGDDAGGADSIVPVRLVRLPGE